MCQNLWSVSNFQSEINHPVCSLYFPWKSPWHLRYSRHLAALSAVGWPCALADRFSKPFSSAHLSNFGCVAAIILTQSYCAIAGCLVCDVSSVRSLESWSGAGSTLTPLHIVRVIWTDNNQANDCLLPDDGRLALIHRLVFMLYDCMDNILSFAKMCWKLCTWWRLGCGSYVVCRAVKTVDGLQKGNFVTGLS